MSLEENLITELKSRGADYVYFTTISKLPNALNQGYNKAILIVKALSRGFLQKVTNTPDYVKKLVQNKQVDRDEFHLTEKKTDHLADYLAEYLQEKGYPAFSQSEDNLYTHQRYNTNTNTTPLPHKTIALLSGLGWIGKHDLLVTDTFGSGISMCSVLTNAPVRAVLHIPKTPQCGPCTICKDICPEGAIKGEQWSIESTRDEIIEVKKCSSCLKCLVHCPWTQKYMNENS